MRVGPVIQGTERNEQRSAQIGQLVVDPGRHGGVDGTADQSIALQTAQGEREHALADALDGAVQLVEAVRPLTEEDDDQDTPLVSHTVEDLASRAVLHDDVGGSGSMCVADMNVPPCAFLMMTDDAVTNK